MSKITVVGAGNVGATCANVLAHADAVNEVVLIDIQGNMAKGKALDMWQQAPVDGYFDPRNRRRRLRPDSQLRYRDHHRRHPSEARHEPR